MKSVYVKDMSYNWELRKRLKVVWKKMQTWKVIMSIIDLCNNVMYSFANLVVAFYNSSYLFRV